MPDGRNKVYRSQIMPNKGFSDPDEIGAELIKALGPYQEYEPDVQRLVSRFYNLR
jgi:hypothetical protein